MGEVERSTFGESYPMDLEKDLQGVCTGQMSAEISRHFTGVHKGDASNNMETPSPSTL